MRLKMTDYQKSLNEIIKILRVNDAKIIAHYYVDEILQKIAEDTGGFVSDSLEMARFGQQQKESTLIVAGVKFMAETAKILSPEKRILAIDSDATCSLDDGCEFNEFKRFCQKHPDREVVVYANTSAKVKSIADWVVTSSIAVSLIEYLTSMGKKLIWAPDKYLGQYVIDKTGADMKLWDGSCVVHEEFKFTELKDMITKYSDCDVLVHPESPRSIISLANVVGSTTKLIEASKTSKKKYIIVATEKGIFYQMKKLSPNKIFLEAPTAGRGATCISCARCPWMKLNTIDKLLKVFNEKDNEVFLPDDVIRDAKKSLSRMVSFKEKNIINKAS
tara:strand:- start:177 stop:1172 length:996 start_codon:yes stop_codon:yes gene_type:complete